MCAARVVVASDLPDPSPRSFIQKDEQSFEAPQSAGVPSITSNDIVEEASRTRLDQAQEQQSPRRDDGPTLTDATVVEDRLEREFKRAMGTVQAALEVDSLYEADHSFLMSTLAIEDGEERERSRFGEQARDDVERWRLDKIFALER